MCQKKRKDVSYQLNRIKYLGYLCRAEKSFYDSKVRVNLTSLSTEKYFLEKW